MENLREWVNNGSEQLRALRERLPEVVSGKRRYLLLGLPIAGLLLISTLVNSAGEPPVAAAPYLHRVASVALAPSDGYQEQRLFSGRVNARQHADMGFEQGGKLAEVLVDEGERVNRGDVLAVLDSELLRIEGREQVAQLDEARAKLKLTENSLKRQKSLKRSGFTSEQRLDELSAERESLLASIERLHAAQASVASRIRKATLLAPFDGVVTQRFADQGVAVNPAQAVLRLQQQGAMEVHIGVPVSQAQALTPGQLQSVSINGRDYAAKILAVGADVHPLTRTLLVRLALLDKALLVNGDLATMTLPAQVDGAGFWLPATALGGGVRGLWNVLVMVPQQEAGEYRLQARVVEVRYVLEQRAFVGGDLRDGEVIVAAGLQRVVAGQLVRTDMSAEAEALVAALSVQP